jgi:hypothetical protein
MASATSPTLSPKPPRRASRTHLAPGRQPPIRSESELRHQLNTTQSLHLFLDDYVEACCTQGLVELLVQRLAQKKILLNQRQATALLRRDYITHLSDIDAILTVSNEQALLDTLAGRYPNHKPSLSRLLHTISVLDSRPSPDWWNKFITAGYSDDALSRCPVSYTRELALHVPGFAWYVVECDQPTHFSRPIYSWIFEQLDACPDPELAHALFAERRSGLITSISLAELLGTLRALDRAQASARSTNSKKIPV